MDDVIHIKVGCQICGHVEVYKRFHIAVAPAHLIDRCYVVFDCLSCREVIWSIISDKHALELIRGDAKEFPWCEEIAQHETLIRAMRELLNNEQALIELCNG